MTFTAPRVHAETRPMQVKFFQEPDLKRLETAVNDWLGRNPRREIVEIRQTAVRTDGAPMEVVVSVWYIED